MVDFWPRLHYLDVMRKKASKTIQSSRAPQERGKKTRELLLLAAIQSMVESNVYGLRYSQISKSAGVPQPLMDYHFPSLESLLMEMVQFQLEKLKLRSLEAIQSQATRPRKALEAYIRAPLELCGEDPGFRAVWTAFYHLATVHLSFADFNRDVRRLGAERIVAMIVGLLYHEKKPQYVTKTKLIHEVAVAIQAVITGFSITSVSESGADFKGLADLAVKASAQILAENFPA